MQEMLVGTVTQYETRLSYIIDSDIFVVVVPVAMGFLSIVTPVFPSAFSLRLHRRFFQRAEHRWGRAPTAFCQIGLTLERHFRH